MKKTILTSEITVGALPYPFCKILKGRELSVSTSSDGLSKIIPNCRLASSMTFDIKSSTIWWTDEKGGISSAIIKINSEIWVEIQYESAGKWVGQEEKIKHLFFQERDRRVGNLYYTPF